MLRTIGPDNAILWAQLRLRGGPRNLLATTATYSVVIVMAMIGTVQLAEPPMVGRAYGSWMFGIVILQCATLYLFAPSRISGAIRQDVSGAIIESHRLMPLAPFQAIIGYVFGASSQATCLAVANVLIGGFAADRAGMPAKEWLMANAILYSFAVFSWIVVAFTAFQARGATVFLFIAPLIIMINQAEAVSLVPGLAVLLTPLLNLPMFMPMGRPAGGTMTSAMSLSIAGQIVIGALFFAAATRKYRRDDVIGFTPVLGLLLLAAWVALSLIATAWWDTLAMSFRVRHTSSLDTQLIVSLLIAMFVAFLPVCAAGEESDRWLRRRLLRDPALGRSPTADWLVIATATVVILPLAGWNHFLHHLNPPAAYLAYIGIVVVLQLSTARYLRRAVRYHTGRGNAVLFLWFIFAWVVPPCADLMWQEAMDVQRPALGPLSCISPVGAICSVFFGKLEQVPPGLMVQAAIAVGAAALFHSVHPAGLRYRKRLKLQPT